MYSRPAQCTGHFRSKKMGGPFFRKISISTFGPFQQVSPPYKTSDRSGWWDPHGEKSLTFVAACQTYVDGTQSWHLFLGLDLHFWRVTFCFAGHFCLSYICEKEKKTRASLEVHLPKLPQLQHRSSAPIALKIWLRDVPASRILRCSQLRPRTRKLPESESNDALQLVDRDKIPMTHKIVILCFSLFNFGGSQNLLSNTQEDHNHWGTAPGLPIASASPKFGVPRYIKLNWGRCIFLR